MDLLATGRVTEDQIDRALDGTRALATHPGAAFWYARCWAEGLRPA